MSLRVVGSARSAAGRAQLLNLMPLCRAFARALELEDCELSLSLVGDAQIRVINKRWRNKDKPTDVLSFPAGDSPLPPGAPRPLGDIVISLETARARAREEGRPIEAELARYLAHGFLHLLGHDHHEPREAAKMAREERRLLGSAGMVEAALGPAVDIGKPRRRASTPRKRRSPRRPR